MAEYISAMRSGSGENAAIIGAALAGYMDDSFHSPIDVYALKDQLSELVDGIYVTLGNIEQRDRYTDAYFSVTLQGLFSFIVQQGVLAFYVVDNEIRDDRFKLITELFTLAGFAVVYPYDASTLQYSTEYTTFPVRKLEDVQSDIYKTFVQKRHILYVEKDGSVNYLREVVSIAEQTQVDYVCIFRNQSVDSGEKAMRLTGSFSHLIKEKQN
jgi:hypothetical protein